MGQTTKSLLTGNVKRKVVNFDRRQKLSHGDCQKIFPKIKELREASPPFCSLPHSFTDGSFGGSGRGIVLFLRLGMRSDKDSLAQRKIQI